VIFTTTDEQLTAAEASKERAQTRFDRPISTQVLAAPAFYPAEDYHQAYYEKNGHEPYCHVVPVKVLEEQGLLPIRG
jgi:peptide-methionine (S)-S-oxide reductase